MLRPTCHLARLLSPLVAGLLALGAASPALGAGSADARTGGTVEQRTDQRAVPTGGQRAQQAAAKKARRYAATAHTATNAERAAADLTTLGQDGCLRQAATRQARVMARTGRLAHQDLGPVLSRCGLRAAGENVAVGYRSGPGAVAGWMGSPGHRANLLQPAYRLEGIGAVRDTRGRWWVAQVFGTSA